jgi:hypothetical protein
MEVLSKLQQTIPNISTSVSGIESVQYFQADNLERSHAIHREVQYLFAEYHEGMDVVHDDVGKIEKHGDVKYLEY